MLSSRFAYFALRCVADLSVRRSDDFWVGSHFDVPDGRLAALRLGTGAGCAADVVVLAFRGCRPPPVWPGRLWRQL